MSAPRRPARAVDTVDGVPLPAGLNAALSGLVSAAKRSDGPSLIPPSIVGDAGGTFIVLDHHAHRVPAGFGVSVGRGKGRSFAVILNPRTGRVWVLVPTEDGVRELAPISATLARGLRSQHFGR